MQTDVALNNGKSGLVIDTKCCGRWLHAGRGDKLSEDSHNLYQIDSYTWNADAYRDGSINGLLLCACPIHLEQPEVDVVIQGNRVGLQALDLTLPGKFYTRGWKTGSVGWSHGRTGTNHKGEADRLRKLKIKSH